MNERISKRRMLNAMAVAAVGGLAFLGQQASAAEGGSTVYLLGSGGAEAAVLPPVEGLFLDNTYYYYDGDIAADRSLVVGGNVVLGLDATIVAQFTTALWVPSTKFLGGTVAMGLTLPVGAPMVKASAVLSGPGGQVLEALRRDSTLTIGDPLATAELGWTWDKLHVTASTLVNIPVGHYREDQLANLSFQRWAGDASLAASWHDTKSGWDVSAKAGVTFNGTNKYTDYDSGNDFHLEAAIEKTFSPKFSAGVQGYYYNQISADSGPGAVLGPNEGEVTGVGVTAAYNTVMGRSPATFRIRAFKEFDAKRRLEGSSVMVSLSLPLKMILPPRAAE
ncbi:transporter [Novosphingobium sp. AP12]|uniref:SphA family protein n=1 Tax=Novosphingobium sp. AP12 TaxID=1144305 RepID=UPI000271F5CF|nr:transporter [Novosphingobium sp. AP12]EJL34163.1 protein involved in meta-pathway of phenol degradation [Novosphingobium sp. AP12]